MSEIINNKRIAKNTVYLYLRTLLIVGINLYASREILASLGVVDYGINNVVGGIVAMFGFLNNAMVAASQRFISFEQGRSDLKRQQEVFSVSVMIHVTIALVILLFAETIGLWFLNNLMNISADRMRAANWVYQSAVLSFVIGIINTPCRASVVAHEKMHVYAVISILDALLRLVIIYILNVFAMDKLILYSILLLCVSLINQIIYKGYTLVFFKECHFRFSKNLKLFIEMLHFAGWSFLGNLGIALRGPGVNVVVNMFCGPAVNAARGVAYHVSSYVSNFVSGFQTAVNPQITKRYAAGEVQSMLFLIRSSAKLSFFLLSIVVVPLYIRAGYVLDLWLKDVPALSIEFLRGVLIVSLINSMCGPFVIGLQATGKIKVFQITICIIMLMDLPISWILLKQGMPPYSVVYVAIITELIALLARIILLNRIIRINIKDTIVKLVLLDIAVCALMFFVPALFDSLFPQTFLGLVSFCVCSVIWSLILIFTIGLTKKEKEMAKNLIRGRLFKSKA